MKWVWDVSILVKSGPVLSVDSFPAEESSTGHLRIFGASDFSRDFNP